MWVSFFWGGEKTWGTKRYANIQKMPRKMARSTIPTYMRGEPLVLREKIYSRDMVRGIVEKKTIFFIATKNP